MAKKVKLTPTPEQILKAEKEWNYVKHDIFGLDEESAEKIQSAFNLEQWDKVCKLCCEIGCDDVADYLSGRE